MKNNLNTEWGSPVNKLKALVIIVTVCVLWFGNAQAITNKAFADKLRARNDSTHIYTTDLLDSLHIYFDGTTWVIGDSGITQLTDPMIGRNDSTVMFMPVVDATTYDGLPLLFFDETGTDSIAPALLPFAALDTSGQSISHLGQTIETGEISANTIDTSDIAPAPLGKFVRDTMYDQNMPPFRATIIDPDNLPTDTIEIADISGNDYPNGITLTDIRINCRPVAPSSYTVTFYETTENDWSGTESEIEAVTISSSAREGEDDGTLTDGDIATGSYIMAVLPSGINLNALTITISYKRD